MIPHPSWSFLTSAISGSPVVRQGGVNNCVDIIFLCIGNWSLGLNQLSIPRLLVGLQHKDPLGWHCGFAISCLTYLYLFFSNTNHAWGPPQSLRGGWVFTIHFFLYILVVFPIFPNLESQSSLIPLSFHIMSPYVEGVPNNHPRVWAVPRPAGFSPSCCPVMPSFCMKGRTIMNLSTNPQILCKEGSKVILEINTTHSWGMP